MRGRLLASNGLTSAMLLTTVAVAGQTPWPPKRSTSVYVALRNEMIHEAPLIPLDGRPHVSAAIRTSRATEQP